MKKTILSLTILATALTGWTLSRPSPAHSHCEVPCGIYGDLMRISMFYENIRTVEKAMAQVNTLSQEKSPNWNQLVRWISNKESHATEIQHIATQYFLTQRVKSTHPKYVEQLKACHGILVQAMKCKQTTDAKHVAELRGQVKALSEAYFTKADLEHLKEHHPEGK